MGSKERSCTICDHKEIAIIEKSDHQYGEEWQYDDHNHWHECACGNKQDIALHIEDGGTIIRQPAETTKGIKVIKCTICGQIIREEMLPTLGTENNGSIQTIVDKAENVPDMQLSMNEDALIDALLTVPEKQSVESGSNIKIVFIVKDATDQVNNNVKQLVETSRKDYEIGQYLDLSLLKMIDTHVNEIHETKTNIRIKLMIPEALKNRNPLITREYALLRINDDKATILTDLDQDANTLTIETNHFSPYVLIYRDVYNNKRPQQKPEEMKKPENTEKPGNSEEPVNTKKPVITEHPTDHVTDDDSPNTKDDTSTNIYTMMLLMAGLYLLLNCNNISWTFHKK